MIPANSLTNMVSDYYTYCKKYYETQAANQPLSYSAQAYQGMSRAVKMITDSVVPTVTKEVRQSVSDFVKTHFSKATCAFALSSLYDRSWLYNVVLSTTTLNLDREHAFRATPLVRDTAICMLALHALKAGNNVWSFLSAPNMPAVVGCLFDVGSIIALSQIIENKEPKKPQEEKAEKTE